MAACQPLDPSKRCVLMERIAGYLRLRPPTDHKVERAIPAAMTRLLQGSAAQSIGRRREYREIEGIEDRCAVCAQTCAVCAHKVCDFRTCFSLKKTSDG
jgi:hypothetical protein